MKNKFFPAILLASLLMMFGSTLEIFSQETAKKCSDITVEIIQVEAQKAIVIKYDVPTANVGPAMGEAYGKLFAFLGSKNAIPAGSPFSVYYSFDPKGNTVFEAGVPVGEEFSGTEEILFKEFPSMKVVSSQFKGAYDKMEPVYQQLSDYIKDNKIETTGTSWEVYLTDPSQMTSPDDNQTLIYFPLK